ncbi:hypothetical protein K440DRAFT_591567, partial [Wilcoxina mikolae CBS 423.85]
MGEAENNSQMNTWVCSLPSGWHKPRLTTVRTAVDAGSRGEYKGIGEADRRRQSVLVLVLGITFCFDFWFGLVSIRSFGLLMILLANFGWDIGFSCVRVRTGVSDACWSSDACRSIGSGWLGLLSGLVWVFGMEC